MGHFGQVLRQALAYPFTLIGIVVSSLAIAVLWGGNIGTVYPLIEVAFNGQSLPGWIETKMGETEQRIGELESRLASTPTPDRDALRSRLDAEQQALRVQRRVSPYIRRYAPTTPFSSLVLIVVLLIAGTLLKNVFTGVNLLLVERLAQRMTLNLRRRFFQATVSLDLGTLGQEPTADLMARFTHDVSFIGGAVSSLFGRSVREPLKMLVCLVGAALISWRLLLVSLMTAPIAALLIWLLARSIKRASRRAMEEMNGMYRLLGDVLGGIDVVKAYTMERYEVRRFDRISERYVGRVMRIATYNAILRPVTELMGIATIAGGILAGGYLVLNQQTHLFGILISPRPLDRGALMTFFALLVGASDPARKLADVYGAIQRGVAACERVFDRMNRTSRVVETPHPLPIPRPTPAINLRRVSFEYVPERPVLREVDLVVTPGEFVAFVGPNGCGKSTLLNLIPRFIDPKSGSVTFGDVDLRQVGLRDLRRRIALVTQRTVLFDDTVLENMRYGAPRATLEEVEAAARYAHIHDFIAGLPRGYDTRVGEAGKRFSGGQRQRIALARAILRNPEILILDEATGQIDPESEQAIHQALAQFARGRITLMVTHRAASLALADRVVVMEDGGVVDQGPPEIVHRRCALFQRLFPSLPTRTSLPAKRHSA